MFKVTLACEGIPGDVGAQAAVMVAEEFSHRPWQRNVTCTWEPPALVLTAVNDFDDDGEATGDEFSDAVAACTDSTFGYRIKIVTVVTTIDRPQ